MSIAKIFLSTIVFLGFLCGFFFWYLTSFQERYYGSLDLGNQKIIVFDFDGTLCDSLQIAITEFNELASKWNINPINGIAQIRNFPLQTVLETHGVTYWKLPIIKYQLVQNIAGHVPNMKTFPELRETLMELKNQGYILGILSSNSYDNINQFLEQQGLKVFSFVYHGISLFGKARLLRKIKQMANGSAIFYVGDENRDIQAAKETNIPVIAVTWGYQSKNLLTQYSPEYMVESPQELLNIVKNHH